MANPPESFTRQLDDLASNPQLENKNTVPPSNSIVVPPLPNFNLAAGPFYSFPINPNLYSNFANNPAKMYQPFSLDAPFLSRKRKNRPKNLKYKKKPRVEKSSSANTNSNTKDKNQTDSAENGTADSISQSTSEKNNKSSNISHISSLPRPIHPIIPKHAINPFFPFNLTSLNPAIIPADPNTQLPVNPSPIINESHSIAQSQTIDPPSKPKKLTKPNKVTKSQKLLKLTKNQSKIEKAKKASKSKKITKSSKLSKSKNATSAQSTPSTNSNTQNSANLNDLPSDINTLTQAAATTRKYNVSKKNKNIPTTLAPKIAPRTEINSQLHNNLALQTQQPQNQHPLINPNAVPPTLPSNISPPSLQTPTNSVVSTQLDKTPNNEQADLPSDITSKNQSPDSLVAQTLNVQRIAPQKSHAPAPNSFFHPAFFANISIPNNPYSSASGFNNNNPDTPNSSSGDQTKPPMLVPKNPFLVYKSPYFANVTIDHLPTSRVEPLVIPKFASSLPKTIRKPPSGSHTRFCKIFNKKKSSSNPQKNKKKSKNSKDADSIYSNCNCNSIEPFQPQLTTEYLTSLLNMFESFTESSKESATNFKNYKNVKHESFYIHKILELSESISKIPNIISQTPLNIKNSSIVPQDLESSNTSLDQSDTVQTSGEPNEFTNNSGNTRNLNEKSSPSLVNSQIYKLVSSLIADTCKSINLHAPSTTTPSASQPSLPLPLSNQTAMLSQSATLLTPAEKSLDLENGNVLGYTAGFNITGLNAVAPSNTKPDSTTATIVNSLFLPPISSNSQNHSSSVFGTSDSESEKVKLRLREIFYKIGKSMKESLEQNLNNDNEVSDEYVGKSNGTGPSAESIRDSGNDNSSNLITINNSSGNNPLFPVGMQNNYLNNSGIQKIPEILTTNFPRNSMSLPFLAAHDTSKNDVSEEQSLDGADDVAIVSYESVDFALSKVNELKNLEIAGSQSKLNSAGDKKKVVVKKKMDRIWIGNPLRL
ncbi:hypothetical protein AYI69_g2174 [Smittium culicis]|uniref:Uncharacterized protein n=1 Tax=Smittium culicis TaxID=133412 RepID=A0A1R1YN59_9FUNG|nr:hypothetical protein AYI69_g2174 [Smittium culicis]